MRSRAGVLVIAILFLILRVALLLLRQPFFDELFTTWIAAKPFAGIVHALQSDSGPPLYYFVVHALRIHNVLGARLLSLACASVAFALLVSDARFRLGSPLSNVPIPAQTPGWPKPATPALPRQSSPSATSLG